MTKDRKYSIKIGFSVGVGKFPIGSRLIQYGETLKRFLMGQGWNLQPWSHVYMIWKSRWGSLRSYEARKNYVGFHGQRSIDEHIVRLEEFDITCTREELRDGHEFMANMCGVSYGKKHIVGLVARGLKEIWRYWFGGKKAKNYATDGYDTFICLEVAGVWLKKVKRMSLQIDLEQAGVYDFYQEMCRLADDPDVDFISRADKVL